MVDAMTEYVHVDVGFTINDLNTLFSVVLHPSSNHLSERRRVRLRAAIQWSLVALDNPGFSLFQPGAGPGDERGRGRDPGGIRSGSDPYFSSASFSIADPTTPFPLSFSSISNHPDGDDDDLPNPSLSTAKCLGILFLPFHVLVMLILLMQARVLCHNMSLFGYALFVVDLQL
jgi:hypothetical protein